MWIKFLHNFTFCEKTLWPLFMDGVQLSEALWGDSLLFTTLSPGVSGTHFIDLGRMKGWVDVGATNGFEPRTPELEI